MPLISVEHNLSADQLPDTSSLLSRLSAETAQILGKPEQYVMARLQSNPDLIFAGSNQPTAYVQLKSLGLPEDQTAYLSKAICQLISSQTNIPTERIYIEFSNPDRHMWGWDNRTF